MRNTTISMLLFLIAACTPAPPASQDGAALREASAAWEAALNAGDIDAVAAFYTEDARVMAPNADTQTGHDAVKASFGPMIEAGLTGALETVEAWVAADIGYNVGTYQILTPDGKLADRGKFVEIWRNVNGSWKISNDIYNSDLPVTTPDEGATLMITHDVDDADRWLAAWRGKRQEQFARHGAPDVRVFRSNENPTSTGLLVTVADMAAFTAFIDSDEGTAAKAEDGVRNDTIQVLDEID